MSTRSIRPLIGSWIAYWLIVGGVKLGPAALAIWRATRGPEGTGNVNVNFGNGVSSLNVLQSGSTTYSGSASVLAIALWFAGPPLVSWLWWLMRNRNTERVPV